MTKETNKVGRPKVVLTDEQIIQVEDLSAYLTCEQIGDYFGISHDTFTRIKQRDNLVLRAYKKGKAHKILRYAKKLDAIAMGYDQNGDTTAIIFLLKTQAGWSTTEKTKPNFKIPDNKDPMKIIDAAIDGWSNGDLTPQEAQQVSSLALAKKNIQTNVLGTDKAEYERIDREETYKRAIEINKAVDNLMNLKESREAAEEGLTQHKEPKKSKSFAKIR